MMNFFMAISHTNVIAAHKKTVLTPQRGQSQCNNTIYLSFFYTFLVTIPQIVKPHKNHLLILSYVITIVQLDVHWMSLTGMHKMNRALFPPSTFIRVEN